MRHFVLRGIMRARLHDRRLPAIKSYLVCEQDKARSSGVAASLPPAHETGVEAINETVLQNFCTSPPWNAWKVPSTRCGVNGCVACMRACLLECVRVHVRACVRVCVRARACMRACVRARACVWCVVCGV